jgi:hypothetical protein
MTRHKRFQFFRHDLPQTDPASMEARFDRARRYAQDLGNILLAPAVHFVEQ